MATCTSCDRCGAELGPGMRGLQLRANPTAPDPIAPRVGPEMDLCTPCIQDLERSIRLFLTDRGEDRALAAGIWAGGR